MNIKTVEVTNAPQMIYFDLNGTATSEGTPLSDIFVGNVAMAQLVNVCLLLSITNILFYFIYLSIHNLFSFVLINQPFIRERERQKTLLMLWHHTYLQTSFTATEMVYSLLSLH